MQTAPGMASGFELTLAVWRRRKWLILLVFFALFPSTVALVRSMPDVYESTVTVLVGGQQVAEHFVGPSVVDELMTRLQTTHQEVLSRVRLYELIMRFGLYPTRGPEDTPATLAESMRRDIRLEFTEAREATGREAPVAFTISYRGRDPEIVAQVANALAALYVERSASIREEQATGTITFLQTQLDEAKKALDGQDQRLNDFRIRYVGELPEQQTANLSAVERLNAQLRMNIDAQLRAMDRRDELVRLGAGAVGPPGTPDDLAARLTKLRQQLADLRTRYTDEHPDVVRTKSEIADLERQLAAAPPRSVSPTSPSTSPARRPKDALAQVDAELAALKSEEQTLRRTIADYQQRVEISPRREGEYQQIARDYAAAKDRYQSLLQRYQDAQVSQRMAQAPQGEQFRILDPAVPAQRPVGPHRVRLMLVGLMLAAGVGTGLAMLVEGRDTSFHTVDDVRTFTDIPVLVSIPPIITPRDLRRHRLRFGLATLATGVVVAAMVRVSLHFAHASDGLLRFLIPSRF